MKRVKNTVANKERERVLSRVATRYYIDYIKNPFVFAYYLKYSLI